MADELEDFFSDIAAVEAAPTAAEEAAPAKRLKVQVISAPPAKPQQVQVIAAPPVAALSVTAPSDDGAKAKFSFSSSSSSTTVMSAKPVPAPAPPPGLAPPPPKPITDQYKGAHMGMTEREAQSVASQQSAYVAPRSIVAALSGLLCKRGCLCACRYDYEKQQQLSAMGVKMGDKKKAHVRVDAKGNSWVRTLAGAVT